MDIIIRNGLIVDGTRCKPYMGNVYVDGGKIVKVEKTEDADNVTQYPGAKVLDAKGHVIAPGFMDIHCHSDQTYLTVPTYESMLTSGTTFQLAGLCGNSIIPLSDQNIGKLKPHSVLGGDISPETYKPTGIKTYGDDFDAHHTSINGAMMVGHGALRASLIGFNQRPLTDAELDEMCEKLDAELKAGGFGLSLGLIYPPGSCCDKRELLAMAKVCAANNKMVAVHMRNENKKVFEALDEMIEIAEETGIDLEISHLKLMGKAMHGRANELLAKIDTARAHGLKIGADQYPYTASRSLLAVCFPSQALDGGHEAFAENLKDEAFFQKWSDNETLPEMENRGGAENIVVNDAPRGHDWPEVMGKTVKEIAEMFGVSPAEAARRVLIRTGGRANCIYHSQSLEDNLTIMSRRDISVISDGTAFSLKGYKGKPHPRNNGTFPRFFKTVREHNLMPIEDAVYKTSALPATRLGIDDKYGYIREGYEACITIFDKDEICDHATYSEPELRSTGIDYVIVNGELVFDGEITDARPGKFIYSK